MSERRERMLFERPRHLRGIRWASESSVLPDWARGGEAGGTGSQIGKSSVWQPLTSVSFDERPACIMAVS